MDIDVRWINNWTIGVSTVNPIIGEEIKKLVTWTSKVYAADVTKPKVNGKWQMCYKDVENRLYSSYRGGEYIFERGYAPYLLYHLDKYLEPNQKLLLDNHNPFYEELHFDGLYDHQNDDLNALFKWKQGNFSVYTSYGKTQVICTFANYLIEKGFRVVIASPSAQSLNELKLRYNKLTGKSTHEFSYNDELNFINIIGFARRNTYKDPKNRIKLAEYLSEVDVLICDEAEYCVAEGARDIMHLMTNVKMVYGFSGTTDKAKAEPVSVKQGITGSVGRNSRLAGLLGFTLVYKLPPDKYNITINTIVSDLFRTPGREIINTKFCQKDEDGNSIYQNMSYFEQMKVVYTDSGIVRMMENIMREAGLIFFPLSALTLIDHYNLCTFNNPGEKSVIISGRGIELYISNGTTKEKSVINLATLKDMVKSDPELKVIYGTKSAYNALDLPGLSNIMMVNAKLASAVLQCVGRCARVTNINIFMPRPTNKKDCSFIYNDYNIRKELIENYYKNSTIINKEVNYEV